MNVLLIYYTGTFNTRYVSGLIKERLIKNGHVVTLYEIDPLKTERLDYSKYDLIGLGYPIYGFNVPCPFMKFIKKQKFPKGKRTFIYKNSGETYHANDASSVSLRRKLKRDKAAIDNEYHFLMPYNIHFRFDEHLVKEMLEMDEKLLDILCYELEHGIKNIKRYRLLHRVITFFVRIQYVGGSVNSFFYHVGKDKCVKCGKCIKECPTKNIYESKKGEIRFHHNCLMCMRCSFQCPENAIRIGFLEGWKVNGPYDYSKIKELKNEARIIKRDTKGFFKCYIETYRQIDERHNALFGEKKNEN